MPIVDVVDAQKNKVGSVDLPNEVFGCKPHGPLVHEAVVMQRACVRQGTASTLRRGEVSGSGKSPGSKAYRTCQGWFPPIASLEARWDGLWSKAKGLWVWDAKKKYRAAIQSALSAKVAEGSVIVVTQLAIAEAKTKLLATALTKLESLGAHCS